MSARDNDLEHVALTNFFFLGKNIFEQVDSYNCYILIQKKKYKVLTAKWHKS